MRATKRKPSVAPPRCPKCDRYELEGAQNIVMREALYPWPQGLACDRCYARLKETQ